MKKAHILMLSLMLATPAFAAVLPDYYDSTTNYTDDGTVVDAGIIIGTDDSARRAIPARPTVSPTMAGRLGSRTATSDDTTASRTGAGRGAMVARTTSAATAAREYPRATVSRISTDDTTTTNGRNAYQRANVSRETTTGVAMGTVSGTTSGNAGRVAIRSAGTSARVPSIASVSVSNNASVNVAETVKEITANLDSLAELADYCKQQYTSCMDNFCNVLDDNQGRCSCSKNVKNYEKTEEALRLATEELQDVAQRIQYIGLTTEEIKTLFAQTEAEMALQNVSDNSKIKNDLDRIKNMIVEVKSGSSSASVTENSGISIDFSNLLSFNIDSYGFDLSGLFGTTNTQNTQSIGNQRGEALYKSAAARCKTAVLSNCSAQGVDIAVIVNAYDVEIDKQCIQYERALTDSNSQMLATVRNAKTVLQKARLMVAQQKNQYDLRGCISALDSCMQDDYVCGNDYEECLDPTGKYIVAGEVVVGSMPGEPGGDWRKAKSGGGYTYDNTVAYAGLYKVWDYSSKNIWSPKAAATTTISDYISSTLTDTSAKNTPTDISTLLQTKIGYYDNDSGRNYGMCMSVLNKCQDYTYEGGKYNPKNQIIREYLQRAFRQIKSAQDNVLSKHAQNCLSDVSACLSQNNYAFGASTSTNYSDIAIRACLPIINTCRSVTLGLDEASVNTNTFADIYEWLDAGIGTTYRSICENSGGKWTSGTSLTDPAYAGTCTCSGTGAGSGITASSDAKSCVCASGTPARDPTDSKSCVTQEEATCKTEGGSWSCTGTGCTKTCQCPKVDNKTQTWNGTHCVTSSS